MREKMIVLMMIFGLFSLSNAAEAKHPMPNMEMVNYHNQTLDAPELIFDTIESAKMMRDDTKVKLRGKIVKRIKDKKYLFTDHTGSIVVEIDKKRWKGQIVTPRDIIDIYGEVERDDGTVEIEVDHLIKLKSKSPHQMMRNRMMKPN